MFPSAESTVCIGNSLLNIRDFYLSAYCVKQTDSKKDWTHTQIITHECELIVSVSSARLTAMQTYTGNLSSRNQEKGLCSVNTVWTEGESKLDSDSWRETVECWKLIWQVTALLISPLSVALRVRKEGKQGHPIHRCHLVLHDTLQSLGVDWWRTQCTEESQASELQIDKCKLKTSLSTRQKLVCVRSANAGPDRYYSDLNVVILQVSQTQQQTIGFFAADNTWPDIPSALLETTWQFSVHCPSALLLEWRPSNGSSSSLKLVRQTLNWLWNKSQLNTDVFIYKVTPNACHACHYVWF